MAIGLREAHGCAIRATDELPLTFNLGWSHGDCTAYLSEILPNPFLFAHSTLSSKSIWTIAHKDGKKFSVVPGLDAPDGKAIKNYTLGSDRSAAGMGLVVGQYLLIMLNRRYKFANYASYSHAQINS